MRPLILGYLRVRIGTSLATVARARQSLVDLALREGYTLGEVFVEADENRSCAALVDVIEAARNGRVAAVAVPSGEHLGRFRAAQVGLRQRVEREAGVPVLVAVP